MNQNEVDSSNTNSTTNKRSNFQFTYDSENFLLSLIYKYKEDIFTRGNRIKTWEKVLNEFNLKFNSNIIQSRTINHRFQTLKSNLKNKLIHESHPIHQINLNENERLVLNILEYMYTNNFCSTNPYYLNSSSSSSSNVQENKDPISSGDNQQDYSSENLSGTTSNQNQFSRIPTNDQQNQYVLHNLDSVTEAKLPHNLFQHQVHNHQHQQHQQEQEHHHQQQQQQFVETPQLTTQQIENFNSSINLPNNNDNYQQDIFKTQFSLASQFNSNQQLHQDEPRQIRSRHLSISTPTFEHPRYASSSLSSNQSLQQNQQNSMQNDPILEGQARQYQQHDHSEKQSKSRFIPQQSQSQQSQSQSQQQVPPQNALQSILKQMINLQNQNNLQIANLNQDLQSFKTDIVNKIENLTSLINNQQSINISQQGRSSLSSSKGARSNDDMTIDRESLSHQDTISSDSG
ncbi:hypothetical protein KGF54_003604 [Candida jiufengensis]|uniref:uncharacterized protein n=1 Tax=Candida jiufengensis TaxID=497108 RepID=UPI0022241108|nr:uncharacterized protein KGF54_003604 [Candida jiufengensis]KAI5952737.1 hypothetical protein KGF54_003604 [Candida jiufengensis]